MKISFLKEEIKKEISHLKTTQNKLTSKKFQLGFMIDPMGSFLFFSSMWYASTCLNSWAKLFRTYCSTSLGIASLLTALDVSRLANLEANLEALAICSCTFDIFWKATWLLCSPIFHLKWHCA